MSLAAVSTKADSEVDCAIARRESEKRQMKCRKETIVSKGKLTRGLCSYAGMSKTE